MTSTAQFVSTSFSLAAVFAWGTSDFLGGYAARRANTFLLTSLAHATGLILMLVLATATHAQFPSERSILWAIAGGISGGGALALFYRALATGRMGLTAPVAAVVGAAVPTVFDMATEGAPGALHIAGFVIAAAGIWLISRSEDGSGAAGLGLAAISGTGFAGFYLCISQAKDGSALWLAVFSRVGALAVTGLVVLLQRNFRDIARAAARWGMLAGCLDVSGTALFVRASQTGRLDSAVVLTSLYPAITVLLARLILREHFTRWKAVGLFAALLAVPMIASG
ncbi:MAG: EamA family transporter [Acidobacteriaceae bacterium]|nr:EamA family transporter [Acidobacteriaceae bacterium]